MNNYKQLSQELYENLKRVQELVNDYHSVPINKYCLTMSLVNKVIEKYEKNQTNKKL